MKKYNHSNFENFRCYQGPCLLPPFRFEEKSEKKKNNSDNADYVLKKIMNQDREESIAQEQTSKISKLATCRYVQQILCNMNPNHDQLRKVAETNILTKLSSFLLDV